MVHNKKWLISISVLIVLLLLGFGVNYYLKSKATTSLYALVENHAASGVKIEFKKLNFNLVNRTIGLESVKLSRSHGDSLQWSLEVDEIYLAGFEYYLQNGNGHLHVDQLGIAKPRIEIWSNKPDFDIFIADSSSENKAPFEHFFIGDVVLDTGSISYQPNGRASGTAYFAVSIKSLNFDIVEKTFTRQFSEFRFDSLSFQLPNGIYRLMASEVVVNTVDQTVIVDGFAVKSNFEKEAFHKHFGHRKSRVDLDIPRLKVDGFAFSYDKLSLAFVYVHMPRIELSRDNRLPFPERHTLLPQQMLSEVGIGIEIETVKIHDAAFDIEISGNKTEESALLYFKNIDATLSTVQNTEYSQPAFSAVAGGTFMGEAKLRVETSYLYGPDDPWHLKAEAQDLDLKKLNPLLTAVAGMNLNSGLMHELEMNLSGNVNKTEGNMTFYYEDLQIELADDVINEQSGFLKFLVIHTGRVLYKKDNLIEDMAEPVQISKERNVQKDFTGQWLDALMEGMLQTVSKVGSGKNNKRRDKKGLSLFNRDKS